MPKPIINIADVALEPRPSALAPTGRFVFVGRAGGCCVISPHGAADFAG